MLAWLGIDQRRWTPVAEPSSERHHRVLIVGGGSAGITVAASLRVV